MSDYTKTVDFAAKDSLPSGNSGKIIKGTEFETEFDNIATAIATKANLAGPTFTGVLTFASFKGATGATVTTILDEDDMATNSATALATQQSIKAYVDAQQDTVDTLAEILALGNATGGTDIAFGDNDKAIFGAGSDLQIYHNAGTSFITESGSGNLKIGGENLYLQNTAHNENYLAAIANQGVTLYYNNLDKLATTTTGVDVTGTVTADGLTVNSTNNSGNTVTPTIVIKDLDTAVSAGQFTGAVEFETSDTGNPGVNSYIRSVMTGSGGAGSFKFGTGFAGSLADRVLIDDNGDISFYEDTGTTPKLFWDASAESLGIGTNSPSTQLHVLKASADANVTVEGTGTGIDARLNLYANSTGVSQIRFGDEADTNIGLLTYDHSDNSMQFRVNDVERMRIDSSGNLGIGTSSPDTMLELSANNNSAASNNTLRFTDTDTGTETNQQIGKIEFKSNDSSGDGSLVRSYILSGSEDATPSSFISFATNPGGAGNTTDERMRISSLGHVGIGSTAPDKLLVVQGASAEVVISDTSDAPLLRFRESGVTKGTISTSSGALIFDSGGDTERMRLDASGNLLVNKTTLDITLAGTELRANGLTWHTTDGIECLGLNRLTSDGKMLDFRVDSLPVGSIGSQSGDVYISSSASGHGGLRFANGSILPLKDGSLNAGEIDLGQASGDLGFKDLYLSGGAYLGGTAAANKLDDYEEGTFTPAWVGGTVSGDHTYTTQAGFYTKVGNLVTFLIRLTLLTKGTIDGSLILAGLPFTSLSTASSYGQAMIPHAINLSITAGTSLGCVVNLGATTATIKYWDSTGGASSFSAGELTNTSQMFIHGSYMTA